jgi:phage N-6-adenine-methyltransferase
MSGKNGNHHHDSWATPAYLYEALDMEFGFNLDPAPYNPNFDPAVDQDGLKLDWDNHRVFVNPPYSRIGPWVSKAIASQALTVMVLPTRTDTKWFHTLLDNRVEMRWFYRRVFFQQTPDVPPTKTNAHPMCGVFLAIIRRLAL